MTIKMCWQMMGLICLRMTVKADVLRPDFWSAALFDICQFSCNLHYFSITIKSVLLNLENGEKFLFFLYSLSSFHLYNLLSFM